MIELKKLYAEGKWPALKGWMQEKKSQYLGGEHYPSWDITKLKFITIALDNDISPEVFAKNVCGIMDYCDEELEGFAYHDYIGFLEADDEAKDGFFAAYNMDQIMTACIGLECEYGALLPPIPRAPIFNLEASQN